MAVYVQITGQRVGSMPLYEMKGQQGRVIQVPSYRLILSSSSLPDEYFKVTRDTSAVMFGDGIPHYNQNGECPPSRICAPYRAVPHEFGEFPDALRLFEPGASDDPKFALSTLRGAGKVPRRGILIHGGPARSDGCFTMENFALFRQAVEMRFAADQCREALVFVLPRHFGTNNPLSVQ